MPKSKYFVDKQALAVYQSRPSTAWMFTINNYTNDDIHHLFSLPPGYSWIAGKEVAPTTGTKHLQGLFWSDNKHTRAQAEVLLGGRAYLERPVCFENALGYTLKEGDVLTNTVPDLPHFLSQLRLYLHYNHSCTAWLYSFYSNYVPTITHTLPDVANFWDMHHFLHHTP